MGDILNFDPNRKLEFDVDRDLEFNVDRELDFSPGHQLEFNPNRDLGFGRRGVVFRGYVCPICDALVTEDSVKCGECGTVFEPEPRAAGPSQPGAPIVPAAKPPEKRTVAKAPPKASPAPTAQKGFCAYCGVRLHAGDSFCWNCGMRAVGEKEVVKLPAKKSEPVARDWRHPEEK